MDESFPGTLCLAIINQSLRDGRGFRLRPQSAIPMNVPTGSIGHVAAGVVERRDSTFEIPGILNRRITSHLSPFTSHPILAPAARI
jgi:hypothetical protein